MRFSQHLSKFQRIAATVDIDCIISRNPVNFRSIFIEIDTKDDEIDEKIGQLLHFLENVWLNFCKHFEIGAVQKCVRLVDLDKC